MWSCRAQGRGGKRSDEVNVLPQTVEVVLLRGFDAERVPVSVVYISSSSSWRSLDVLSIETATSSPRHLQADSDGRACMIIQQNTCALILQHYATTSTSPRGPMSANLALSNGLSPSTCHQCSHVRKLIARAASQ